MTDDMDITTFDTLRKVNQARARRWHHSETQPWSGADWSNAMQSEAGEAGNVVKKLRRVETGITGLADPDEDTLLDQLGEEIADTIIYLDLLADYYGIDLWPAIVAKFNRVSARENLPERLA